MSKWLIVIGLLIAVVPTILFQRQVAQQNNRQNEIEILVAERALDKGSRLTAQDLRVDRIPAGYADVYGWAVSSRNGLPAAKVAESYLGRTLTMPVRSGEILRRDHFQADPGVRFDAYIDRDKRAITVGVTETSSVSGFIGPGNQVDVLGVIRRQNEAGAVRLVTESLLEDVTVLAVGDATTWQAFEESQRRGYSTITLEVTPAQARDFLVKQEIIDGGPIFVLRNGCATERAVDGCLESGQRASLE